MSLVDVQLRVVPKSVVASASRSIFVAGYTTTGPVKTPTQVASIDALTTLFGTGAAVEEAAVAINAGRPVIVWRDDNATLAYGSPPVVTTPGTSAVTYDATTKPTDRAHLTVLFTTGGDIGTAGIKYKIARCINPTSDDFGPELSLGTAAFIASPEGIKLLFGAGTVLQGQKVSAEGVLPKMATSAVDAALKSLKGLAVRADIAVFASEFGTNELAQTTTTLENLKAYGLQPLVFAPLPAALAADTPATWLAAVQAIVATVTDWRICVGASEAPHVSLVSGRTKRLASPITSVLDKVAKMRMSSDLRSIAAPASSPDAKGARPDDTAGATIQSLADTPVLSPWNWDERQSGAFDSSRIANLNRVPGWPGTYIGSAQTLGVPGTAIQNVQDARVAAFTYEELRRCLMTYAGRSYDTLPQEDNLPAGRLTPYELAYIEGGVNAYMSALLGITSGASGATKVATEFAVHLDPNDSINDERIAVTFEVRLLNSLVLFSGDLVVSK